MSKKDFEFLEQHDFLVGEYIYDVEHRYAPAIGFFLISFSSFEHELNSAIAGYIHDRTDEPGLAITQMLSVRSKIELFYKLYIRLEAAKSNPSSNKEKLKNIYKRMIEINNFRNKIVHANWISLQKGYTVRTKTTTDNENGYVKFERIKILPSDIKKMTIKAEKMSEKIISYMDGAFQF